MGIPSYHDRNKIVQLWDFIFRLFW